MTFMLENICSDNKYHKNQPQQNTFFLICLTEYKRTLTAFGSRLTTYQKVRFSNLTWYIFVEDLLRLVSGPPSPLSEMHKTLHKTTL